MQLYSGLVRLAGSVLHEVRKPAMTPAEIIVLRSIHGEGAVVQLEPCKADNRPRSHRWERKRLVAEYGEAVVIAQFGQGHQRLPVTLEAAEPEEHEYDGDLDPGEPEYDDDDDGFYDDQDETAPAEAPASDTRQTTLEDAIRAVQAPPAGEEVVQEDTKPAAEEESFGKRMARARAAKAAEKEDTKDA